VTKVTIRALSLLEICDEEISHSKFQTMKKNTSTADRIVRLLLASAIAILYFTHQIEGKLAAVLGIAAIVLAVTAVINFCPIYYLLGFSTRKKSPQL